MILRALLGAFITFTPSTDPRVTYHECQAWRRSIIELGAPLKPIPCWISGVNRFTVADQPYGWALLFRIRACMPNGNCSEWVAD